MVHEEFVKNAALVLRQDSSVIGLAVAGSWISNEIDEFSDIDLILVTKEKVTDNKSTMLDFAARLGKLLSGFTGEHVGEPRLLICLYDNPLLHVDIKFVTLQELHSRVETPVIIFDTDEQLQNAINETTAAFPYPDYQWIEDRFWIWVHYALLKIGRGEYTEAFDFLGFLRMTVLGPLLHIKNGNLPKSVRKVETQLSSTDFELLRATLPTYSRTELLVSLRHSLSLYQHLRDALFSEDITLQSATEERVMQYFDEIERRNDS
jgi:predicted nucleotidyltransferase